MRRKLKVFRTAIGFHDAYVAAPSRKAALVAWGSTADLFARGMAEEVTDPALAAAPLDRPGEVIRVARGSAEEHLAALPAGKPKARATTEPPSAETKRSPPPQKKRAPPPSRAGWQSAQNALAEAETDLAAQDRALAKREADLAAERRRFDRDRSATLDRLRAHVDEAEHRYRGAVARWEE